MRKILAVLAFAALSACGSDSTSPASISVVGVYQVRTVNGASLPFVLVNGNPKTELTSDQFSLNADGTWSEISGYRVTSGVTVTTTQGSSIGVYRATNGAVQLTQTSPSSASYAGSVNGSTMTMLFGSLTFVYGR